MPFDAMSESASVVFPERCNVSEFGAHHHHHHHCTRTMIDVCNNAKVPDVLYFVVQLLNFQRNSIHSELRILLRDIRENDHLNLIHRHVGTSDVDLGCAVDVHWCGSQWQRPVVW
jgi:hypothetical protein